MNADYLLDPSYGMFLNEPSSEWTIANLPDIRNRISSSFKVSLATRCEQKWTKAALDDASVRLCLYRPESPLEGEALPAILYIHGGGFVLGRPEMLDDYLAELATELKAVIVAVDYRLAPEHPFPTPLEDCYAGLNWIFSESIALGVDIKRIVVMGHSAGGGLAAALAILVRDRGRHHISGLVTIYPMLDHRTGSSAQDYGNPTTGTLSWSREANQFCWSCLQGSYSLNDNKAALFSPSLASDLGGLPPSFVCVGALDLFLEESIDFALKLSRSAVPVEMHVYPGVPHMFDQYPGRVTDQCTRDVIGALTRMLADKTVTAFPSA